MDSRSKALNREFVWLEHHLTFGIRGVRSSLADMAMCNTCGATFTRKSNMRRHQNGRCKGRPDLEDVINNGFELAPTKKRKLDSVGSVKFLPETVEGLSSRFNELFPKYWKNKDHTAHNELVSLLDALLQQHGITRNMYRMLNNLLSESVGDGIKEEEKKDDDDDDDDNELEAKVSDTVEYLIRHDRAEIGELLKAFEKEELFEEDVSRLRQLAEEWIENEILGKGLLLDDIDQILKKLKSSSIPKSQLHRFKMLLSEIQMNRSRVSDILHRMNLVLSDANEKFILDELNRLLQEGKISEEQYNVLTKKINDLDLDKVIWQIKSTKIGRGLEFLPRETPDLLEKLKQWVAEFSTAGTMVLRQKILSVLDELLFRKIISKTEYKDVKETSNIDS